MKARWLLLVLPYLVIWSGLAPTSRPAPPIQNGCLACHGGIEEMHPGYALSCIDCHGGDATVGSKDKAHVAPTLAKPGDERVVPLDWDLRYRRFKNPSDLRVADLVCGTCHGDAITHLKRSLHGTTAGHLGDGFYEHGLVAGKKPNYSVFPVSDDRVTLPPHAIRATQQVPPFRSGGRKDQIATHYSDLPRKACMTCHLWSEGRAINGRLGLDGDYRGEGCAACHVTYAENGRSQSKDPSIDKNEPGHPLKHRMTSKIPTQTCTHCHYGDAAIGLQFRGMSQLVPGQPAGPEVKGTTDHLINGTFYVQDQELTPPDIHHEKGMHCIDCHTLADTMGDGAIYPQMDFAVEIECASCHGNFDTETDFLTSHGRRIPNLSRENGEIWLTSKVTGKQHKVTQVKRVVTPGSREFNPRGHAAMTSEHEKLECYACHSAWNVDFFGFHFDRNEQFTQLDLISGERTPGRVTTQEKVFATFNQLRLGWNHEANIAPWMVGFSTIGSAHDAKGAVVLKQSAPETQAGLSGVTMIPHQMHTVRKEARECAECHRSATTWGLGSPNFRLTRELAYATTRQGLVVAALDQKTPGRTQPIASLAIEGTPKALALLLDRIQGHATHAYVAGEDGFLTVISLKNPVQLRVLSRKKALVDPKKLLVAGRHLYAADGVGGVQIFDLEKPDAPRLVGSIPTVDARSLALSFPWLHVADGAGGLATMDVRDPTKPVALANVDLNAESSGQSEALDVTAFFQYSRMRMTKQGLVRTRARALAFVACGLDGVRIVDVTEPSAPKLVGNERGSPLRFNRGDVRGVAINTVFDLGSAGGGLKSQERDYLYVFCEEGPNENREQRLRVFDVSDPLRPLATRGNVRVYGATGKLAVVRCYNPPFLQHFVVTAGAGGLGTLIDVSKVPTQTQTAAIWSGVTQLTDLAIEELALDRMQDEEGRAEKDVSHEGPRYVDRSELLRILGAQIEIRTDATDRYGGIRGRGTEVPKEKR